MYNDEKGKKVITQFEKLRSQRRQRWDFLVAEAYRWTDPLRGVPFTQNGLADADSDPQTGRGYMGRMYDTTAPDAIRVLASSLHAGATPPTSQWFRFGIEGLKYDDLPADVKAWLQDCSTIVHSKIHSSNYDGKAVEIFTDYPIAGMVAVHLDRNEDTGKLYFDLLPLYDVYCMETLQTGVIDTVYRRLSLTVSQAIAKFGLAKLSDHCKNLHEQGQHDEPVGFIHKVKPRIGADGKQVPFRFNATAGAMRWESCYVEEGTGHVVQEGGYQRFPFIIPRWRNLPNSCYSESPTIDAMPEIKTVNKIREQMLRGAEMGINPPVAVDDGAVNVKTVRLGPGRIIRIQNPRENFVPVNTGYNPNVAMPELGNARAAIRAAMLANELEPLQKRDATAYEVDKYYQLMRQRLGPTYSKIHNEMLTPMVHLAFHHLMMLDELPAPPQAVAEMLASGELPTVEYNSPLARAGRLEELQQIDRLFANVAGLREIAPDVLDLIDFDKAIRLQSDILSVPAELVRTDAQVTNLRKKKQAAMEQQQAMMMQQQG